MSWEWYMLAADAAVAAGLYILHRNTNRNIQNIKVSETVIGHLSLLVYAKAISLDTGRLLTM